VGLSVKNGGRLIEVGALPLLAMAICVLVSVGLGLVLGGGDQSARIALGLNSGIRNISLSLLLAKLWFDDPTTKLTVIVYGLVQIALSVSAAVAIRRKSSA
jgi:predicted Na+-dependent transporter